MDLRFNFSLVNLVFIFFSSTIIILGGLLSVCEPYLPVFIIQTFRYGKHKFDGKPNVLISRTEIPKSWFKHFYVFATCWSVGIFVLAVRLYLFGIPVAQWFIDFLDFSCGSHRSVKTSRYVTLIALGLVMLQCLRRFYETHFVSIFSNKGKINLAQYAVGYFHYYGAVLIILSEAQGFNNDKTTTVQSTPFEILYMMPYAAIFLFAWVHQFQSNIILSNLRKNSAGNVVTQNHSMPSGGCFEYVSSPHMLFEILLYLSLYGILHQNSSWIYVVIWVISNQLVNARLTHKWYIKTFPNYPKTRTAIIPKLL